MEAFDTRAAELASLLEIDLQDARAALEQTSGDVPAAVEAISSGIIKLSISAQSFGAAGELDDEPPLLDVDCSSELKALERCIPPCDLLERIRNASPTKQRHCPPTIPSAILLSQKSITSEASFGQISLHSVTLPPGGDPSTDTSMLPGREAEIVKGLGRLCGRLQQCGLRMVEVKDDGNCLFRACSAQLYRGLNSVEQHMHVRRRALAELHKQRAFYESFFSSGTEFDDYVHSMAQPAAWGDELMLRAIADAFFATVHVLTSNEDNWYLVYKPTVLTGDQTTVHLFLTYIAPVHYNLFERIPVDPADIQVEVKRVC